MGWEPGVQDPSLVSLGAPGPSRGGGVCGEGGRPSASSAPLPRGTVVAELCPLSPGQTLAGASHRIGGDPQPSPGDSQHPWGQSAPLGTPSAPWGHPAHLGTPSTPWGHPAPPGAPSTPWGHPAPLGTPSTHLGTPSTPWGYPAPPGAPSAPWGHQASPEDSQHLLGTALSRSRSRTGG